MTYNVFSGTLNPSYHLSICLLCCCGYCRYGIVLKKLDLTDKETVDVFVEAVSAEPLLWSAWLELSLLISDRDMVPSFISSLYKLDYDN